MCWINKYITANYRIV